MQVSNDQPWYEEEPHRSDNIQPNPIGQKLDKLPPAFAQPILLINLYVMWHHFGSKKRNRTHGLLVGEVAPLEEHTK